MFKKPLKDVFIAVPTKQDITAALVPKLIKYHELGADVNIIVSSPLVDYARNKCVQMFLKTKKKYLLFIDSDNVPDVDAPQRLLKHKKPIVGGLYNCLMTSRTGQNTLVPSAFALMVAGRPLTDAVTVKPNTGMQKVAMVATGCLLIHRKVFEQMPEPWFTYEWLDARHDAYNGEDVYFCIEAGKRGIEMWCDTDCKVLHLKNILI